MAKLAVVLTGTVTAGHDATGAWAATAKLFKLDPSSFHARVQTRCPLTIRETENAAEADSIRAALAGCGVAAVVVEANDTKWTLQRDGKTLGPVPLAYLENEYRAGNLGGQLRIKEIAGAEWVDLSTVLPPAPQSFEFDVPPETTNSTLWTASEKEDRKPQTYSILDIEEVTAADWQTKVGGAEKGGLVFVIFYSATTAVTPVFVEFLNIVAGTLIPQIPHKVTVYRCCLPQSQALVKNLFRNLKVKSITISTFGLLIAGGKNSSYFLGDKALASRNAMLRSLNSALIHKEIKAENIPQPTNTDAGAAIHPMDAAQHGLLREITILLIVIAGFAFYRNGISLELVIVLIAFASLAWIGDLILKHTKAGQLIDGTSSKFVMYAGLALALQFLNSHQLTGLACFSIGAAIGIFVAQKMNFAFKTSCFAGAVTGVLCLGAVLAYQNQNSTGIRECDEAMDRMDELKACIVERGLQSDVDVESLRASIRQAVLQHDRPDGNQEAAIGCRSLQQGVESLLAKCRSQ